MFLFILIKHLFACEFDFTLNQSTNELQIDIQQAQFIAYGIWSRYYTFYIDKSQQLLIDQKEYSQIFRAFNKQGKTQIQYQMIVSQSSIDHQLNILISDKMQSASFTYPTTYGQYETVWIFLYIGFNKSGNKIQIFLVNTKTNEFQQQSIIGQVDQVDSAVLYEQFDQSLEPLQIFSGQVSFTQSQQQSVNFVNGESLLTYLLSCNPDTTCSQNSINKLISGILNTFQQSFQYTQINNYWIDGWFLFTPLTSMETYNNLILKIVQYDQEGFTYNGMIPLQMTMSFDTINLENNGIMIETSSYISPRWYDQPFNPKQYPIFDSSYQELLQSWVYFRYIQYDQTDHNAEFYLSFQDSKFVNSNMGQINLFQYGQFFIYLGFSQLYPDGFFGQIANLNIQSCLTSYPQAKRACHYTCLTCAGPMEYNCLSCLDQTLSNRILNTLTNTCECKIGFISAEGQVQCLDIQTILKSSKYQQLQIQQPEIQPCKDGQFQYFIGSNIKCYDCPQQASSGIQCGDCIENLLTWQTNMRCSFDYYQVNNNQDNTFIKYIRPQQYIDYYYIQDELLICQGCQLYQGGKQILQDKTVLYGSCHLNYYYNNSSCHPCQQNCQNCDDYTGLCSQCETGFVLYYTDCQSCPDYCLICLETDQFTCSQCIQGYTPGNGICQKCGTNCHYCEYNTDYDIPRCLACISSSYFLLSDGVNCALNTIAKCIIQYQYSDSLNTLIFNFEPQLNTASIVNKCALCKTTYMNYGTYCQKYTTVKSDEQVLDINGSPFYLISSSQKEYVQTDCNDDQCSQCLMVKGKLRCILCAQGFYANMFNGKCIACPLQQNCKTCQQQNKYYQDGWKWNIRAYFNYTFQPIEFVDVASSIDVKDYEIICLACNTGYMLYNNTCIQNCPINCKSCSIINGQNVCTFCGSNNYGKLLTNYNNQCSNCPFNCQLCQPRSQKDVQTINSLFNPDDASKYYYSYLCLKPSPDPNIFYNQFLQQYVKCKDGQFCVSQIIIKLKAHCDQQSYDTEKSKYTNLQDFQYENVQITEVFANTTSHFQQIESPQFIEYLNVNQIVSLIYELTLMSSSDTCQINNFISTKVPRNVFSILENKLMINGNNLNLQSQGAQILNFSEVQIYQAKFYLPFSIKIFHPTDLIVSFKNINYVSSLNNDIDIILINPSQIQIQNFYIEAIEYLNTSSNNMISYQYTNSSTVTNLNIKIDNLQFIKSQFYNLDFLILMGDAKILSLAVYIRNSIIESTFYNSSFLKESTVINKGQISLVNVTFIVQVYQASLINLNGQLNIQCSIKLTGTFTTGNFLRTNQFQIFDSQIYNTFLTNSTLIDNKISKLDSLTNRLEITNLIFNKIQLDNASSLISIVDNNVQDQLIIQNIQIMECEFKSKNNMKSSFRLIRFEGQIFQIKDSFFNKSVYGLTDISIKYCSSALIQNVTVVGYNILGLQNKLDCYQELVSISQQNGFIQLENVQSIQIIDSQFNNIMIQNYPIIGIFCFDDSIEYQIQVTNTSFKNNLILITELKSQGSVFQLLSPQPGNFTIFDVTFTENVLNEYLQNQFQNSATTFLIEAEEFNITFNNTLFNKNQMLNSSDSILYILAQVVVMQYSTFTKSNMYDDFILQFVIWGTTSTSYDFFQENLQDIFPIIAVGGNAKLVADTLLIGFCQFSYSTAQQGSGFHLTLQNLLQIVNTTFIGLKNILDQDDSQGGALYITLIAYNATLEIYNTIFDNTYSLYDGGAIYINSRYTTSNITLSQINVSNCYSLKGTFISVYLNKYSTITITNISVKNDIQTFRYYLSQIYNLTDNYVEQFHQSSAIFYIQYGSLYISNFIISDISLSSVLQFFSAADLYLYNSVIQNIQFGSLGLIQIYPTSNINTMTYIKNVQIINCNNVSPQLVLCQNKIINYQADFQCININKPTSLSSYPQDSQSKINCFQQRLLEFTSSSSMIYVDMIQISDYLYISDLHMSNNNCSLCKDGLISIKNIDINTPEFNNIIFEQLYFQNNSCGSGCLVVSQDQTITFPSRRQLSNILYSTRFDFPSTVTLEESEFLNNTALNGMIIVSNLSLLVIDDKFVKNKGTDISGGVLFLGNQNNTFNIMTSEISDSIGNKGGALYLINKTISSPSLLQVLLSSNYANSFGSDFVDTPQALTISLDGGKTFLQTKYVSQNQTVIQQVVISPYKILGNNTLQQFVTLPTGYKIQNYQYYDEKLIQYIPYNLSLRIIPLNNLKQQIKNLQNTNCTIQRRKINVNDDKNSVQFEGSGLSFTKIQFYTTTQDYNLDELVIGFDPYLPYDYVLQLQFKCTSVQIPTINSSSPYNIISYSNNYELRMNIRTFKCQRGESYNVQLGTCNLCDSTSSLYSVVIKASKCSVQDEITMKSVNSTHIELRSNYWRPYYDNNIVTYCFNLPVDCNGGWSPGDDSCALGHIGALCEQCDLYNTRGNGSYAISGQFQCGSCADISINTISIAFIMLWTLISIFLSVKGTVENVDELVIRMRGIKAGFVCVYFERVQIAVLMKILTNYLQIISSIGTFQLQLPPGLKDMFTYVGNPVKSMTYSLDCFLIELSNISILYFRNLWSIFMPFYYSTIIFLIYLLILKIKTIKFNITVISTTLIYIFIYVQPDIIGGFISLLSYRKISQVLWVQGNVSYLYLTAAHARWLLSFVLPVLVVFGFLIPIILYRNMSKFKDKLDDTNVLRLYGYLYNEYSKVTYYWEILKIGQKELIIVFLIFYEDVIVIKGTLVFIIIFAYDIFSKSYKPYKRIDLNELDSQNSFVCAFSIVLGMAIYVADQSGNSEILWPFYLLMGIFNLYFIIRLITLLILGYVYKMTDQIDQIRDKINQKYPNIVLQHPWLYRYLENSKIKTKRVKQRYMKLREYLWKKALQNVALKKNQKLETEIDQQNEQKELKDEIIHKELKIDVRKTQILPQDTPQVLIQNNRQKLPKLLLVDKPEEPQLNIPIIETPQVNNSRSEYGKLSNSYLPEQQPLTKNLLDKFETDQQYTSPQRKSSLEMQQQQEDQKSQIINQSLNQQSQIKQQINLESPNISIHQSQSNKKSKNQSYSGSQEKNEEKINNTLNIQQLNNEQEQENIVSEKPLQDYQDQQVKKDKESNHSKQEEFENIQEFDFHFSELDFQNSKDNEEQQNLSFQQ
ncbi:hypothetical protein pb186bvf_009354 [Paramecium bursaria]